MGSTRSIGEVFLIEPSRFFDFLIFSLVSYYMYTQTVRSHPLYGITTFEAKEKRKDAKKLQSVRVGITRDAVVTIDPNTRQV